MDIYRMEREAQGRMSKDEPMDFVIVGPLGKQLKAKWLDPYFGFLQIDGEKGFVTSKQLAEMGDALSVEWSA